MKAIILAAGKGTRMMPLTEDKPKVMIEVNGKPFLWHLIQRLKKAGLTDIAIVAGYKKEVIERYFDYPVIEQKEQLGSGDAVKCCKEFVNGESFVLVYGDGLYDVQDFKQVNVEDEFCYICGLKVEDPSKYGVLFVEDGFLKKIVEKPKEFVGNLINAGLYKFTPEIFDALDRIKLSERGEYELTDAVTILAEQGKVKVLGVKEFVDFGKLEDIPKVKLYLSEE
ncbi:NTP transferase domain-containing protein [Candidatus Woesearchaeota archaeon]|nr:NTP transferase domain-containing protein [Candidatus Woesearchaeota archaeon]MBW3021379.1 NTP transferase domain-containing protein [Candidatus Woesearchaeota archaeon]